MWSSRHRRSRSRHPSPRSRRANRQRRRLRRLHRGRRGQRTRLPERAATRRFRHSTRRGRLRRQHRARRCTRRAAWSASASGTAAERIAQGSTFPVSRSLARSAGGCPAAHRRRMGPHRARPQPEARSHPQGPARVAGSGESQRQQLADRQGPESVVDAPQHEQPIRRVSRRLPPRMNRATTPTARIRTGSRRSASRR